jgi:hypothetical protein
MEILESMAYIALGFIPTLALLEIGDRIRIKITGRKGLIIRRAFPRTKSLLP